MCQGFHKVSHRPHTFTWSPAACNRQSVIYTLHSDAQRPVYRSATWTSLTLSILQYSCDSRSPQLQHDPDPPAKNSTSVITDKNQRTAICVSAYLVSLSALSFNKPVIKTNLYSLTFCLRPVLWQKTGPYNIHLHGSPAPNTCRCPWGTRQHPPDFTHTVTSPLAASGSPMALPASYACDAAEWGSFPLQVALFIEMQPQRFLTGRSKVAFLISLLTGKALLWDRAIWNANSLVINSYDAFINHFKEVFSSATGVLAVSDQLLWLSQGFSTISDYTLQFCTLAATAAANEAVPTAPIVMDWVQTSAQLCQSTMTWSDWKISCKKSPVFHNAYWHASPTKPLASLYHPPSVFQYQNLCGWIPSVSLAQNVHSALRPYSASTVQLLITSSRTVPSDPHALRWVPSN